MNFPKMEDMRKTKKKRLSADFSLSLLGGWGGYVKPKQDNSVWKFQTYRGNNLDYDLLCEPTSSDNEEKEGDNLSDNCLVNQKS